MKRLFIATCAASACILSSLFMFSASAEVLINGHCFEGQELAELEKLLGTSIVPGSYWLNTKTGDWGYEGDYTVRGNLLDDQESSFSSRGRGSSDSYDQISGKSYSSYASDGVCAYFFNENGSISTCD